MILVESKDVFEYNIAKLRYKFGYSENRDVTFGGLCPGYSRPPLPKGETCSSKRTSLPFTLGKQGETSRRKLEGLRVNTSVRPLHERPEKCRGA